ncbi:MAG: adenylate/guanylate cyclase domain-containing protein, partial [Alphaproteobacteria bacterium]|nr:adenylate/guanylate cyclase domain-containing protein [Alphaproteobacteria bacterium]
SPVWAKIVNALTDAEARAIGFDIIFSYSANRFPGLEGQYDREFLAAIARARGKIVLARSAGSYPALPYVAAVFDPTTDAGKPEPGGIAYAELAPDADGIFRRVGAQVDSADGRPLPTLAHALLDRGHGPTMPQQVMLAPRQSLEAIPTYRLIDVLRCLDRDPAAIKRVFGGKTVLLGTTLAEEDRKRSPDRFMQPPGRQPLEVGACHLLQLGASDPGSGTVPGVFIHAAAIGSVLNGNLINPVSPPGRAAAAAGLAVGGGLLGFSLAPLYGVFAVTVLAMMCLATTPLLIGYGLWFPAVLPAIAAPIATAVAYVVRFVIEDRRRRRVQQAFGHYLAPAIVERLSESEAALQLGGEERDITVMFADLSGFTALSGRVGPTELMTVTNAYLAIIVAAVEATGGYVDKFIGDAVMGIWGAPGTDPDHAAAAARAALAVVAEITRAKAAADARGQPGYSVKIGVNSGRAVVGNVGAEKRYNYTAVGETVNIAARLESVPGDYACRIVIGPATAATIADRFVLNELDWIKVKGKEEPFAIFELLGERGGNSAAILGYEEQFQAALRLYRAGEFKRAAASWRALTHPQFPEVSPPSIMADRAAALNREPRAVWDGVYVKETK